MLQNTICLTSQDFATSPFLLLLGGQASDRLLLYSEGAKGHHPLSIVIEYLLPSLSGNKLFSEIRRIFILWVAEQVLRLINIKIRHSYEQHALLRHLSSELELSKPDKYGDRTWILGE